MKPEHVKQLKELIGISAVVLSLLLVAYQIRQANQIAQATATYEIVRDINQFNDMGMTDPAFANLLVQLTDKNFTPSKAQEKQAKLLAHRFLNVWTIQEEAFRNGLFTEDQFSLTRSDVLTIMNDYPALLPYWKAALTSYPGFAEYEALQPILQSTGE